jgi:predicted phosphodiesterase
MGKKIRVLTLSDQVVSSIHSSNLTRYFKDIDLIVGCGDLTYYCLEFILSMLDAPLFSVHGNHDKIVESSLEGKQRVTVALLRTDLAACIVLSSSLLWAVELQKWLI